jgi:hypothetical protein
MGAYIGLTPPADASTAITASLSAAGTLLSTPTAGYQSISVQLTGTWVGSVVFQASNDNTNWVNVQGYAFNTTESAVDTAVNNDIYLFPVIGFYFRAVVTTKTLTGWNPNTGASTSTDISFSGTVSATAYLRTQGLAGLGEAALTQAMDQTTGTPMNVVFPGMAQPLGQQAAATSIPVAMANEQVQDKFIVGKVFTGNVPVNVVLNEDASAQPNIGGWIDCTQYGSIYVTVTQSASVTAGAIQLEVSNDGVNVVNNPIGFFDVQGVASGALNSTGAGISLSGTAGTTLTRVGNIAWRYVRLRVSTAIASTATNVQAFITLRKVTTPYMMGTQMNFTQIASSNLPIINQALSATNTNGIMPIGGYDYSVVRPDIQGAPYPIAATNSSIGPYWRRNYVDFAGNQGVAGPDPRYAEDKTYPVNVRLEHTTSGQDSVQDLLQQMLVEFKALNYYIRELPQAIAAMNQLPNPQAASNPASMQDDSENFADDPTTYLYRKGH